MIQLLTGDSRTILAGMADASVDAVVTDPPYELGFMGKAWDSTGVAYDVDLWREVLRVLKPGGHLMAFGGSRTYHRLAVAIEDAGFQIRDQIQWLYGSGFPKSLDVSKAIDKAAGADREVVGTRLGGQAKSRGLLGRPDTCGNVFGNDRGDGVSEFAVTVPATDGAKQWNGWGTALKPAHEPIVLARKPLEGTVADSVLTHGTGALNVDGGRIPSDEQWADSGDLSGAGKATKNALGGSLNNSGRAGSHQGGRWPANVIHDGSDEVCDLLGDAARFFYGAKASKADRGEGNDHPTVKPCDLMRYLARMITPPGGTILDPFMGSGSTGKAAVMEGFGFIGIDLSDHHVQIARRRIDEAAESLGLFGVV